VPRWNAGFFGVHARAKVVMNHEFFFTSHQLQGSPLPTDSQHFSTEQ